ncbi:hypothetical protein HOE67_04020 [Candidatus Peregrinibacteria bacterium]|nr:hypothetical protein [Candidatus Peregrinibacteria bacterium]MBT4056252.1 hypothetical protein [Candidatus Peregrinibacteria bacterium]
MGGLEDAKRRFRKKRAKKGVEKPTFCQIWGKTWEKLHGARNDVLWKENRRERMAAQEEMDEYLSCAKSVSKPEMMKKMFEKLQEKYPKFKKQRYALLGIEDPEVYYFLENASLGTLLEHLGLDHKVHLSGLDVDGNWKKAIANNGNMEKYRDSLYGVPDDYMTFAHIYHRVEEKQKELAKVYPMLGDLERSLLSDFSPKVLLAIFVNEQAPHYMGRPRTLYFRDRKLKEQVHFTQKARVELYRMMLEAGWQPQKAPARNASDDKNKVESFGIDQCILPTALGITRNHGEYLKGLLPEKFEDQVTLDDQIVRSLVLAYENLRKFLVRIDSYKLKWKKKFWAVYEKASDEDRHRFVMTLVAAMHNNGGKGKFDVIGAALKYMMTEDHGTLEYARRNFVKAMGGATSKSKRYTRRASELFDNLNAVYGELESWDPMNGVNVIDQRKLLFRNMDAVTIDDLGLNPTSNVIGESNSDSE